MQSNNSENISGKGTLIGMCNPLIDIIATVDQDFLNKYDLKANDAILAEDKHFPIYDEIVEKFNVEYAAGGAGQNSLRGAQRLLPANSTIFIGCAADDKYGKKLKEAATADGLETAYCLDPSAPTGTCATLINGYNRSLVTNLAAANNYKFEHLKSAEIWSKIEAAKIFYITGYFVTVSPQSILEVAKHAAENNKLFCMNISAPFIPQFFKKDFEAASPYWDVLFGNETEAEAFSDSFGLGTKDLKEIALYISKLPKANAARPRMVIITHGPKETIVAINGEIRTFAVPKVPLEEIVDCNGAGDAFVGGFLGQYVFGKPLEKCIDAGHWMAGQVIRRSGAVYPEGDLTKYFD
ncbi:adenosine kinase b [Basidiobolus meristosporus CBS 931.73]|uniref:Adenosine kinase n=1 Tax=Basidiobolus meristosporus CBS 931.73 TaxID=1314790 RepID=A0A1Y1YY45_9FUNG|nr:adenosine kinase b [Basidiobolus meristosporus CBS 931.73]|eukprot:ORY02637.1 adenosine kinase b [Basidiobolus meristosporus CBS 931.73]